MAARDGCGPSSLNVVAVARFALHIPRVKSLTEQLWFNVPSRRGFVNITETVADLVMKSGVNEGLCLVNAMHITWDARSASSTPGSRWEDCGFGESALGAVAAAKTPATRTTSINFMLIEF